MRDSITNKVAKAIAKAHWEKMNIDVKVKDLRKRDQFIYDWWQYFLIEAKYAINSYRSYRQFKR